MTDVKPLRHWSPYRIVTTVVLLIVFVLLLNSSRDQGVACTSAWQCHIGQVCRADIGNEVFVGSEDLPKQCESFAKKFIVI